jgi:hypothetical protein
MAYSRDLLKFFALAKMMGQQDMKCVSVRQPYAWAILKGIKWVENRGDRFPEYLGPVLIHAGKRLEQIGDEFPGGTPVPSPDRLPLGAILGPAAILDRWPIELIEEFKAGKLKISTTRTETVIKSRRFGAAHFPGDPDVPKRLKAIADDPSTNGPECMLLGFPFAFDKPVPYTGQVGLFNVDPKTLSLAKNDQVRLNRLLKRFSELA